MIQLRDESSRITDVDLWRSCRLQVRAAAAPSPKDRGACSCGRAIVSRFGIEQYGHDVLHSRRRCIARKAGRVTSGAKW